MGALLSGLVWSRHWWGRRCWRSCLRSSIGAKTFLPDQHADQEEGHVVDALSLDLSFVGAAGNVVSDGGHGSRLVVNQAIISDLNSAEKVVHTFVWVLFQVCEVGADGLGGVLWFVGAEERGLHLVPDGEVGGGVSQGFPPDDGAVSKTISLVYYIIPLRISVHRLI